MSDPPPATVVAVKRSCDCALMVGAGGAVGRVAGGAVVVAVAAGLHAGLSPALLRRRASTWWLVEADRPETTKVLEDW